MSVTTRVIRNARRRGVKVVTRRQWGNRSTFATMGVYQWRRRFRPHAPLPSSPSVVIQHITVTNPSVDGIREDMRTLHRIGMERFGSGVSYNFCVDMTSGVVGLGQSLDAKGAHTQNDKKIGGYPVDLNRVGLAIAVIGMPGDTLTPRARTALVRLLASLIATGAAVRGFDYLPHSYFAAKDCPCDETRDEMPSVRRDALK